LYTIHGQSSVDGNVTGQDIFAMIRRNGVQIDNFSWFEIARLAGDDGMLPYSMTLLLNAGDVIDVELLSFGTAFSVNWGDVNIIQFNQIASTVSEPASLVIWCVMGLMGLAIERRRRRSPKRTRIQRPTSPARIIY
jgi:hypothetical protein